MKNYWVSLPVLYAILGVTVLGFNGTSVAGNDPMAISEMSSREQALPPLPPDVVDLRFNEFFKMPVGSFGLEPTKKLLGLQGKKVRLLGYMTREEQPAPGVFVLASLPVQGAEAADGPADDLPPTATFVHVAVNADKVVPYTPGLLLLTGRLDLGATEESLDRVSNIRLYLDPPSALDRAVTIDPQKN